MSWNGSIWLSLCLRSISILPAIPSCYINGLITTCLLPPQRKGPALAVRKENPGPFPSSLGSERLHPVASAPVEATPPPPRNPMASLWPQGSAQDACPPLPRDYLPNPKASLWTQYTRRLLLAIELEPVTPSLALIYLFSRKFIILHFRIIALLSLSGYCQSLRKEITSCLVRSERGWIISSKPTLGAS